MGADLEKLLHHTFTSDENIPLFSFLRGKSNMVKSTHSHAKGEFVFPCTEVVKVFAKNTYWYVPPDQGLWIPPKVEHHIISEHPSILTHINDSDSHFFSEKMAILTLSPLVKELIKKTTEFEFAYKPDTPEHRLATLLMIELMFLPEVKLSLPMASDERIRRVIDVLTKNLEINYDLDSLSKIARMSSRNMERLFETETGMSVGAWRRQQKILFAIEKLNEGEPVSHVAAMLGYNSLSAFIEMFRKAIGKTPSYFLKKIKESDTNPRKKVKH